MNQILVFITLFTVNIAIAKMVDFDSSYSSGFSPKFDMSFGNENIRQQQPILGKRPQPILRNCYLSPIQCLLPVEQHQFQFASKFNKRVIPNF
ncbi:unnamed protein product [Caenorhabditis angaria]|uniref:Uncharacterized protein n=1 Tax=Caenorhabditis angaria TaxID=860376 RepID=A0A9P1N997_9PELO|nr:unnamed protein product [Caenorhabditis angaria]